MIGPSSSASGDTPDPTRKELRLRPTTADDIAAVRAMESRPDAARFVEQWSEAQHRACIDDPGTRHWVLETPTRRRTVGYVIIEHVDADDGSALLRRLVIDRKGHGFGRAALAATIARLSGPEGRRAIHLYVDAANRSARALYRRFGFQPNPLPPGTGVEGSSERWTRTSPDSVAVAQDGQP